MIKNRDIVVVGLQSLDSKIGSNCVNIAYEFAKNNRVLYVNYPLDRLTTIRHNKNPSIKKRKKILKGNEPDLVQINKNLWNLYPRTILESINQIGSKTIFNYLNKINNKKYAKKINEAIKKLGFKNYILFNDSDFYRSFYLKELLKPAVFVYYTRDNMVATDYFKKHGTRYEQAIMKKADMVVANSVYLQNAAKKFNQKSYYVGQGCDLTLFDKTLIKKLPEDIKTIKKPVIGYIGALKSSRLDMDVIEHLAVSKPEWSIVLVGPEDDKFKTGNLHNIKNIYFLGSKNIDELPSYLAAFDIAINPQLLNELTIGNYPRKIDEYLAMGKPVLATKTEAMQTFSEYVYLAENKEEYITLAEKALKKNNSEKEKAREDFAKSHTWENNVLEIYKAIQKLTN